MLSFDSFSVLLTLTISLAGLCRAESYEFYPPYCSTFQQQNDRRVPDMTYHNTNNQHIQLRQVIAVIRHGARTPWRSDMPCWKGHQVQWDCTLQTRTTAALESVWFSKDYDAFVDLDFHAQGLSNELNGTCQVGQLIEDGWQQEFTNGKMLREAYLGPANRRMQLYYDERWPWESLYFRADHEQRTMLSGQVLLQAFLGSDALQPVLVPMHTADYARDVLGPNEAICPRLREMREEYYLSKEFQAFNTSEEAMAIRKFQKEHLGIDHDMSIDCLTTTICTDRPMPDILNDYKGDDNDKNSWFARLYRFYVQQETGVYTHNNNEYSKLAIGPLWAEITDQMKGMDYNADDFNRLVLFGAHDTTILPLLASLGDTFDGTWPPYASMLLVEVHELERNFAFRLVYNGQILTDKVKGCPAGAELCNIRKFYDAVNSFPGRNRDCAAADVGPMEETVDQIVEQASHVLSSQLGMGVFFMLILMSMGAGGLAMYTFLSITQPNVIQRQKYDAALPMSDQMDPSTEMTEARTVHEEEDTME